MAENFDYKELGRKIKQAREEKSMSLDDLANALSAADVSRSKTSLFEWESGNVPKNNFLSILSKIADILDVDLGYFLEIESEGINYYSGFFDAILLREDKTYYPHPFLERYFKSTNAINSQEQIKSLDRRWNIIKTIIEKLTARKHYKLVEFATILTHYLYSSMKISERIKLCQDAAALSQYFVQKGDIDYKIPMYLLNIDGVGWMLLQQEQYKEAVTLLEQNLSEITTILESDLTGTSPFRGIWDLGIIILAYAHLNQGRLDTAKDLLHQVNQKLLDIAIIRCRYWIAH